MDESIKLKGSQDMHTGGLGIRHIITVCLCACLTVNYIIRVNLGVAVVVMTDHNRNDSDPVFDWSPEQKGMLLSSFFAGYLISNLVASVLVTKYSNAKLLFGSVCYSTVASLLTPILVTHGGYTAMFMVRVSMGLVQGFMMPATQGLLSKWIPPNERSRCGSIVLGGLHIGTMVSFVSSGFLSSSSGGWPSVFYFSAALSGAWCIVWLRYGSDHPDRSKYVSKSERSYINKSLSDASQPETATKVPIPWGKIFTNTPVYALALTMIGQNWGYWILITQIPSYFANVLNFDTTKNGTVSALPYVTLWLISFPVSFTADYLITRGTLTISSARKTFNTIGQWGAAAALLALAFTTSPTMAVVMYTIGVTMIAFTFVGFNINVLDLAPNYAGLLMGLTNGIANVTSIAGPAFVGFVVKPLDNIEGWKLVFIVAAAMLFVGNTIFVVFGSGEVQDFNSIQESSKNKEDIENPEIQPLKS
ncbi:solute carrier family 17 [Nesidiocoris tenuis]|uniref:Solute carrier family 17 n=1 Tax=Nesidiocoris tenuis TaxID=355587 RepID=A0ABN7AUA7_9HEMI|nr:solute carrier family 17 [Nesidiocoris tenuis]